MARPTATRVAGFRKWLELGYAVNRGERAIKIWAPCPPSRKQLERWKRDGADPDQRPRTYFKLVAVFAQDQVSPLPPPAEPAPLEPPIHELEGDDLARRDPEARRARRRDRLHRRGAGARRQRARLLRARHRPDHDRRQGCRPTRRSRPRCHELAHALIRRERQDDDPELDYAGEELVVESIAYTLRRGARDPQRRLLGSVPRLLGGGLGPRRARADRRADRPAGLPDRERRPVAPGRQPLQKRHHPGGGALSAGGSRLSGSGAGNPWNACHARRQPSRSGLRPAPAARP